MNLRPRSLATLLCSALLSGSALAQSAELIQILQSADPASNDLFGQNLAADGSRLAVSERSGVSIYVASTSGSLLLEDRVLLSQLSSFNPIQAPAIAIDGDRIAVTRPLSSSTGRVEILERSGADWVPTLTINAPLSSTGFGNDLDLDGTRLVVGQTARFNLAFGRAWFVELSSDTPTPINLPPPTGMGGESYGSSVAIRGDWIAVGAPESEVAPNVEGRIAIFRRNTDGSYSEFQIIEASASGPISLGRQVELEGNRLAFAEAYPAVNSSSPFSMDHGISTHQYNGSFWDFEQRASPFAGRNAARFDSFAYDVDRAAILYLEFIGNRIMIEQRAGVDRFVSESSTIVPSESASADAHPIVYVQEWIAQGEPNSSSNNQDPGEVRIYSTRPRNLERFCQADQGCNFCPCRGANGSNPLGGCNNREFRRGVIETVGRARISNDTLGVRARGLNSNTFAALLVGTTRLPFNPGNCTTGGSLIPGFGVAFNGSNGLRCIGGNVRRAGLRTSDLDGLIGTSAIGDSGWGASDSPSTPLAGLIGAVLGQPLHLQIYYRDAGSISLNNQPCPGTINTTDATTVTYLP